MATPVTSTVNFRVNVNSQEINDVWIVHTLETGIIVADPNRDDAFKLASEANTTLVGEWKAQGMRALLGFLESKGIDHDPIFATNPLAEASLLALLDEPALNLKQEMSGGKQQLPLAA